jgi:hypothetical protein
MSRSWERKVERNRKQINKRRKKEGKSAISLAAPEADRFRGRSYIVPALLLMLTLAYVIVLQPWQQDQDVTMFWVTVGLYLLLALFYFLRRPYLAVYKDKLETRRFSGYKFLKPEEIRKVSVQPGYVVIETVKGSNWVFSRAMNLYPIERMGQRLEAFARAHRIDFERTGK